MILGEIEQAAKYDHDVLLMKHSPAKQLYRARAMAPGSSIMPGKVNPIIPEEVNKVTFEVIGNDIRVTLAAEAGQLNLNVMEPLIAYNLFTSLDILSRTCRTLADRYMLGINADRVTCCQKA
jgi:aspartate ammonia-lyase